LSNLKKIKQQDNYNFNNDKKKYAQGFKNDDSQHSNDLTNYQTLLFKLQEIFVMKQKKVFIFNTVVDRCIILYFQYLIIYTINLILTKLQHNKNYYQDILVTVTIIGVFNTIEQKTNSAIVLYILLIGLIFVNFIKFILENK
jgi:hypothetical protein